MAALVPCSACRRHLRHQETACPFCGARQPSGASASRPITIPSGTTRAKIFALGLSLAGQACGGERTEKADSYGCCVPPYGGVPFDGVGRRPIRETCDQNPLLAECRGSSGVGGRAGSGGNTGGAGGSGAGGSGGTNSDGGNGGSGGAAADAGTSDAGTSDAGTSDAGAFLDAGAEDAGRDADDAGN